MRAVAVAITAAAPAAGVAVLVAQTASMDAVITALSSTSGLVALAAAMWYMRQQDRADSKEERQKDREEREKDRAEWRLLAEAVAGMRNSIDHLRWSRRVQDDPGYRDRVTRHADGIAEAAKKKRSPKGDTT